MVHYTGIKIFAPMMKSLCGALATVILLVGMATAQSRTPTDGYTPTGMATGAPDGSYPLSGFDTINLFNGNLSIVLPLLQVGGRGAAGHQISSSLERGWKVQSRMMRISGSTHIVKTVLTRNSGGFGSRPMWLKGVRTASRDEGPLDCSIFQSVYTLTRVRLTTADGTENLLTDEQYQGVAREDNMCRLSGPTGAYRGRVFRSRDGGSMTFISDTDIYDDFREGFHREFSVSGVVLMNDGTRYRIDAGEVSWIRDRNGNKVTFSGDTITDSLVRQVTFTNSPDPTPCPAITYHGFGGATRTIRICPSPLSQALRPDFTIKTKAQLFPEIYSKNPPPFNVDDSPYDPGVISYIELPDGRKYQFFYNSYGEVARVILPTGGGYDYEYTPSGLDGTNVVFLMVYRRLTKRTIYKTLTPTTSPSNPPTEAIAGKEFYSVTTIPNGFGVPQTVVTVDHKNSDDILLAEERHYFFGTPTEEAEGGECLPTLYSPWYSGREFKTESYAVDNGALGSAIRRVEHTWSPSLPSLHHVCHPGVNNTPAPDPKIVETKTSLLDTNQVSKQTFDYDQYNNLTDTWEYGFGVDGPGSLIRRTHILYLTTNGNQGGVNYATADNIHIRSLPAQMIVYDASGTVRSQTDFIYDDYGAYALVACSGIVQHDDEFSTGYGARGNLTGVILRNPGGAPSEIRLNNQYDVAGNLVKAVDGRGFATEFDFSDRFGIPDDESRSNAGAPELAGGFSYAFPTKVTNALNHTAYIQYDYYNGKAVNSENANGIISSVAYNDALDRPTQSIRTRYVVGVGVSAARRQTTFNYDDTNRVYTTTRDLNTFNDNVLTTKSYYDSLGRTARSAAYEGGSWAIMDTQFDALGRVSQVSNPYRAADPDTASPPSGAFAEWTTADYDALGRAIRVTSPGGAHVDTAYFGNNVTVTDQAGKKRRSETDALGRLIRITEDPGGLNYVTFYSYDALGNLLQVIQGAQTRTFVYDSLSRLMSATNPESGRVTYAYDENGNLIEKTDAREVKTTMTYDALNRVRSRTYSGTTPGGTAAADATPPVNYFYDNYTGLPSGAPTFPGTPSKGRLVGVTYGPGSDGTYYKYDAAGRIVTNHQRQGTSNYVTAYFYNLAGAVTREDRGGSSQTRRRNWTYYDAAGRLLSMQSGAYNGFGIPPHDLVSDVSYTPFGGLQSETYGNGLIHSMAYNERLQPAEIRLGRQDNLRSVFRIDYIFGTANNVNGQDPEITLAHNNGNVARIKYFIGDALQYSQTFQYDALNRLRYAVEHKNGVYNDVERAWYQTCDYDRYGNRGINVANTSDNADAANSALQLADFSGANNRITRAGHSYDSVGNLIAEPGKSYTFDAENRIVTATVAGGAPSQYFYDGNGRRVRKVVGGVATRFEYGAGGELIAERNESTGAVTKDYFYKGGELLATTKAGTSGEYQYATADHLGSPRAWTDDSGNLVAGGRHDYMPFGEELFANLGTRTTGQGYAASAQADGQRNQYTSKERDPETELNYFLARYGSSSQGRFISPDPYNPFLDDPGLKGFGVYSAQPQNWNRYTYALNNPVVYVDPDGENPLLSGLIGGITGGAIGAAIEFGKQALQIHRGQRKEFSLRDIGAKAANGAIFGAVAGATFNPAAAAAAVTTLGIATGATATAVTIGTAEAAVALASAGMAGGIAERAISTGDINQAFDPGAILIDGIAGGTAGVIARPIYQYLQTGPWQYQQTWRGVANEVKYGYGTIRAYVSGKFYDASSSMVVGQIRGAIRAGIDFGLTKFSGPNSISLLRVQMEVAARNFGYGSEPTVMTPEACRKKFKHSCGE